MYISPAGELIVYETPHANGDVLLGQFRMLDMVTHGGSLLHPTATVDGPVVVDEGSSVQMTGARRAGTDQGVRDAVPGAGGRRRTDPVWFPIEYEDWAELGAENLKTSIEYVFDPNDGLELRHLIWEKGSSIRWFAPQGCTIAATDYPISSNSWPGPATVLLQGTGEVEVETNLEDFPTYTPDGEQWPWAPVPLGETATEVDIDNTIEGISFTKPVDIGGSGPALKQLGCDDYYNATVGLGWDVDDDGSYESTGTFALFSATQLDGPTTKTVTARAQHPTDMTDYRRRCAVLVPGHRAQRAAAGAVGDRRRLARPRPHRVGFHRARRPARLVVRRLHRPRASRHPDRYRRLGQRDHEHDVRQLHRREWRSPRAPRGEPRLHQRRRTHHHHDGHRRRRWRHPGQPDDPGPLAQGCPLGSGGSAHRADRLDNGRTDRGRAEVGARRAHRQPRWQAADERGRRQTRRPRPGRGHHQDHGLDRGPDPCGVTRCGRSDRAQRPARTGRPGHRNGRPTQGPGGDHGAEPRAAQDVRHDRRTDDAGPPAAGRSFSIRVRATNLPIRATSKALGMLK